MGVETILSKVIYLSLVRLFRMCQHFSLMHLKVGTIYEACIGDARYMPNYEAHYK